MSLQRNQIKNGNNETLSSLLKELEPLIRRFVSYKISNDQDVLDITQETLVRVYRNIHKYDAATAKLTTWVYHITKNLCHDYYRRRKISVGLLDDKEIDIESTYRVDSRMEEREFFSHLSQALDQLSISYRKAFILRHFHEKSYAEIATELHLPLNTVKSHIHRARLILRNILDEYRIAS
ncbi:RNA polymerase sigma factor (plasmid) [Brevibacillus halotolerans]|nr:RNA polymerase sigma factor [Brevibacillus halotolerans]